MNTIFIQIPHPYAASKNVAASYFQQLCFCYTQFTSKHPQSKVYMATMSKKEKEFELHDFCVT
jgi:hypothetical protein